MTVAKSKSEAVDPRAILRLEFPSVLQNVIASWEILQNDSSEFGPQVCNWAGATSLKGDNPPVPEPDVSLVE